METTNKLAQGNEKTANSGQRWSVNITVVRKNNSLNREKVKEFSNVFKRTCTRCRKVCHKAAEKNKCPVARNVCPKVRTEEMSVRNFSSANSSDV